MSTPNDSTDNQPEVSGSCTPCGRDIPAIIRLARLEPKLYMCIECMSIWRPDETEVEDGARRCPEDGEELDEV